MGIAYRDLKAGTYYKTTDAAGTKFFVYIETTTPQPPLNVQVTLWVAQRRAATVVAANPWLRRANQVFPASADSLARRAVTLAEMAAEGISLLPPLPPNGSSSSSPTGSSNSARGLGKTPTLSEKPSKPPALRKNGQPKAVVPENSRSPRCLCCGAPNKILALFQFSTFWCPDCEP